MSRIQKLYQRLDDLERQFEIRVLAELDRAARGEYSRYLARLRSPWFEGRTTRTTEVAELERLTNEVIALKDKLAEPLSSGVTAIVLFFGNFRNVPWDQQPSAEDEIHLVRCKAQELRTEIKQRGV